MLKLYPLDLSPLPGGAKWTFVMDGAAGALREEGACLPCSGGFSSLLVPAAQGTFCGTHLSEFGGTFPGVPRKFCQSPSQLPGKVQPLPDALASAPAGPQRVVHS